jgi:aldehyde:ferredoxin oxidoreductase
MDTISAGVTLSFAMECVENGILTRKDTDGIDLRFGNAEAMVEMLERIALRKGFGHLLAEGSRAAARKIGKGSEAFAIQVKGTEVPMHEPRLKQGMGLHYSVHATGADHCTGIHDERLEMNELNRIDISQSLPSTELSPRKARTLYLLGLWQHVLNSIGLCLFVPWSQNQLVEAMEGITGWPMSYWRLMKSAERGITLARIFNIREGRSAKDDTLPARFFTSPAEGPLKGVSVDPARLAEAQKLYYQMLGWDASGVPTLARLIELDLEWAKKYLSNK